MQNRQWITGLTTGNRFALALTAFKLVILAMTRTSVGHKPANMLTANLAEADLLTGVHGTLFTVPTVLRSFLARFLCVDFHST